MADSDDDHVERNDDRDLDHWEAIDMADYEYRPDQHTLDSLSRFFQNIPDMLEIVEDDIENFSTQGPEHCHIDFCKRIAKCTNNKDVFLTLMKYHVREGHLQYLDHLYSDLGDEIDPENPEPMKSESWLAKMTKLDCKK